MTIPPMESVRGAGTLGVGVLSRLLVRPDERRGGAEKTDETDKTDEKETC